MFQKKNYAVVCEGDSKVRSPCLNNGNLIGKSIYFSGLAPLNVDILFRSSRHEYLFLNMICFLSGGRTVLEIGFTPLYTAE